MYFGDARRLKRCLHDRVVQWSGLVANVAYLGMTAEIRRVLWRFHQKWLIPGKVFRSHSGSASDWEEGSCSDSGEDSDEGSLSSRYARSDTSQDRKNV